MCSWLDTCSRGPGLEPFVTTSLVQLLCRMTKLCWYDEDQYRKIVDDASQFLEKGAGGQPGMYSLGLKLLSMLVSEMNQPTPGRTLTQHRKIAVAFRDQSLLKTFQLSLSALKQLQASLVADTKLKEQVTMRQPSRSDVRMTCLLSYALMHDTNIGNQDCCRPLRWLWGAYLMTLSEHQWMTPPTIWEQYRSAKRVTGCFGCQSSSTTCLLIRYHHHGGLRSRT